jgi:hypothetical protein
MYVFVYMHKLDEVLQTEEGRKELMEVDIFFQCMFACMYVLTCISSMWCFREKRAGGGKCMSVSVYMRLCLCVRKKLVKVDLLYLSVCLPVGMYVCLPFCLPVCMYVCLPAMYVCQSVCLPVCMHVCLPV